MQYPTGYSNRGGGGGGQGGSKEWGAGLGASGSKAACTEDEGMILLKWIYGTSDIAACFYFILSRVDTAALHRVHDKPQQT